MHLWIARLIGVFQVRFDTSKTKATKILFLTEGENVGDVIEAKLYSSMYWWWIILHFFLRITASSVSVRSRALHVWRHCCWWSSREAHEWRLSTGCAEVSSTTTQRSQTHSHVCNNKHWVSSSFQRTRNNFSYCVNENFSIIILHNVFDWKISYQSCWKTFLSIT